MYQSGSTTLANGATSVTVTFPVAFSATPSVILPAVRNVSGDTSKWLLEAGVTEQSATGFTAWFDTPPNSDNYELVWLAGSASSVLDVVGVLTGRKLTAAPDFTSLLGGNFKLPILRLTPVPAMGLATAATLFAAVPQISQIPASAVAAGPPVPLAFAADNNWLYVWNGTRWGRSPQDTSTTWDTQPFYVPFREAEVTLEANGSDLVYPITFETPFDGVTVPKITLQLTDLDSAEQELVTCRIVARSVSGFSVMFSAPLPNDNLKVYYQARQIP